MVPRFEDLTEGSFAYTLVDLKSVSDMVVDFTDVLPLVVIKAPVLWAIRSLHLSVLSLLEV